VKLGSTEDRKHDYLFIRPKYTTIASFSVLWGTTSTVLKWRLEGTTTPMEREHRKHIKATARQLQNKQIVNHTDTRILGSLVNRLINGLIVIQHWLFTFSYPRDRCRLFLDHWLTLMVVLHGPTNMPNGPCRLGNVQWIVVGPNSSEFQS